MTRIAIRFAAVLLGAGLIVAGASSYAPQAQAPAGGVVAFTNARVIDGTGAAPIEGATIVVSDGRIQAVGKNVSVPAGATIPRDEEERIEGVDSIEERPEPRGLLHLACEVAVQRIGDAGHGEQQPGRRVRPLVR